MADRAGQIYVPRNVNDIRDRMLRDMRLAAFDSGAFTEGTDEPPVEPGGHWWILSSGVANIALIGYANAAISNDETSPLTASRDGLLKQKKELGLSDVNKSPSSGKIRIDIIGATTINDGRRLTLPNGREIKVVGTYINPADGAEIDVIATTGGSDTNLAGGQIVRFVSPPVNTLEIAHVSENQPLSGGTDDEDTEQLRNRILNALANRPAGGNWSHLREIALSALSVVQDCFIYPAPGGPGSVLIVPVRKFDRDLKVWSRALSSSALALVRSAIYTQAPSPTDQVVQSPGETTVDVALQVNIPDSTLSGGSGDGWLDATPWPPLVGGDSGRVTVTTYAASSLTVTAATTTPPVDTRTTVAWWSDADMKFYTSLVLTHSGSSGAWVLNLQTPLVDSQGNSPASGDFVSPAAVKMDAYGTSWIDIIEGLGPGEVTSDANRLPRAKRHPFIDRTTPSDLSSSFYCGLQEIHKEMTAVTASYTSATTPGVPGTVASPPNILVPRHFAIYPE